MAFNLAPTDETFVDHAPKRYVETFEIARPAATVWNDLTMDSTLHWCRALSAVTWTSPRPFGVGTTRTVKVLKGMLVVNERYIRWEEGRRKTFVGVSLSLPLFKRISEDYLVEPAGEDRCRFTWTVGVEPTTVGKAGTPMNNAIFASLFKDTRKHYGI